MRGREKYETNGAVMQRLQANGFECKLGGKWNKGGEQEILKEQSVC